MKKMDSAMHRTNGQRMEWRTVALAFGYLFDAERLSLQHP